MPMHEFYAALMQLPDEAYHIIMGMQELLDDKDADDEWGTEGWRHRVGLE